MPAPFLSLMSHRKISREIIRHFLIPFLSVLAGGIGIFLWSARSGESSSSLWDVNKDSTIVTTPSQQIRVLNEKDTNDRLSGGSESSKQGNGAIRLSVAKQSDPPDRPIFGAQLPLPDYQLSHESERQVVAQTSVGRLAQSASRPPVVTQSVTTVASGPNPQGSNQAPAAAEEPSSNTAVGGPVNAAPSDRSSYTMEELWYRARYGWAAFNQAQLQAQNPTAFQNNP